MPYFSGKRPFPPALQSLFPWIAPRSMFFQNKRLISLIKYFLKILDFFELFFFDTKTAFKIFNNTLKPLLRSQFFFFIFRLFSSCVLFSNEFIACILYVILSLFSRQWTIKYYGTQS